MTTATSLALGQLAAADSDAPLSPVLTGRHNHWVDTGKQLGSGKYGVVTLGHDARDPRARVALKRVPMRGLDENARNRLEREVLVLLRLEELLHQHIMRLLDVSGSLDGGGGAGDDAVTLVLELCEGGDLLQAVQRKGRLEEAEARRLFRQLASAMASAHAAGVIHRDLKVENILLDADGNIKVGDWGFACEWGRGRRLSEHCGSLPYAAPEIVTGREYSGPEIDVWSLGVVLFAMLTGGFPFRGADDSQLAVNIADGNYLVPAFVSNEARHLLHGMLSVNPGARPATFELLRHPWLTGASTGVGGLTNHWYAGKAAGGFGGAMRGSLPPLIEDESESADAFETLWQRPEPSAAAAAAAVDASAATAAAVAAAQSIAAMDAAASVSTAPAADDLRDSSTAKSATSRRRSSASQATGSSACRDAISRSARHGFLAAAVDSDDNVPAAPATAKQPTAGSRAIEPTPASLTPPPPHTAAATLSPPSLAADAAILSRVASDASNAVDSGAAPDQRDKPSTSVGHTPQITATPASLLMALEDLALDVDKVQASAAAPSSSPSSGARNSKRSSTKMSLFARVLQLRRRKQQ